MFQGLSHALFSMLVTCRLQVSASPSRLCLSMRWPLRRGLLAFDESFEVCKGSALPDEIVNKEVLRPGLNRTVKERRGCEPSIPVRARVRDPVYLDDAACDGKVQHL